MVPHERDGEFSVTMNCEPAIYLRLIGGRMLVDPVVHPAPQ